MRVRSLHRWDVSPREAAAIQQRLADRVSQAPLTAPVRLIAGADVSYERHGRRFFGAVVVCRLPDLTVVDSAQASGTSPFPYVPGLLTFREGPVLLEALARLETEPDVVLFDGQGRPHPRRLGLASHLGLWLDRPTIGCAKSRLVGVHRAPGERRGSKTRLMDSSEVVGMAVRTRDGVRPVYVSVGHRVALADAVRVVLRSARSCRLPEPTRQAHALVNRLRAQSKE